MISRNTKIIGYLADENEKNRYKVEKELNPQYTPKPEEEVEMIHVELSE